MYVGFKWLFILCIAIWIGYHRYWISKLSRSQTKGSPHISTSFVNKTDNYEFYNRSEQIKDGYLDFKLTIYKDGPCGDLNILPKKRPCTPFLHIHPYQTEKFTVLQGQFAYQSGDKIYFCDIHTCPRPIIIPPLTPHTFWMSDNKEDVIFIVRVEPAYKDRGMRATALENIVGAQRDKCMTIWQAFVFLDNIETYPIFIPLFVAKLMGRICSLIGQLLGYKLEYEEYTTKIY